jgi:hypothetical protein
MRILPVVLICRTCRRLRRRANQWPFFARPALTQRGASRSSRNVVRDMMDAQAALDERRRRIRQRRVVLISRRWDQVSSDDLETTVAKKPGHRGERAISRKAIVQGMPACSGVPVATCLRAFFTCTQGCGCGHAPGIPCALFFKRDDDDAKLGHFVLRDRGRSSLRGAQRRSNPDYLRGGSLDCFASLAMTNAMFDS